MTVSKKARTRLSDGSSMVESQNFQDAGIASITLKGSRGTAPITSHVAAALPPISMRNARLSINGAPKCVSLGFALTYVGLLASILRLAVGHVAANVSFSAI